MLPIDDLITNNEVTTLPNAAKIVEFEVTEQDLPDTVFKEITRQEAAQMGLETIETEYQQSFRIDMVLKASKRAKLSGTLFYFFRIFNIIEFKSENDKLDQVQFNLTEIRARLMLSSNRKATYENTLSIIVCAREPKKLFNYMRSRGYTVEAVDNKPWLIQCKVGLLDVMVIVCYKLPLEKSYYPWLIFTSPKNRKWRKLAERLIAEKNVKLLLAMRRMRPKELEMIEISNEKWEELINQMSPKYQERYDADMAEASQLYIRKMQRRGRLDLVKRIASEISPETRLEGLRPEERLVGLKPEERLVGLKPEERLVGLKPEEREALRKLLDEQQKEQQDS